MTRMPSKDEAVEPQPEGRQHTSMVSFNFSRNIEIGRARSTYFSTLIGFANGIHIHVDAPWKESPRYRHCLPIWGRREKDEPLARKG
jgi:hypothetical protein